MPRRGSSRSVICALLAMTLCASPSVAMADTAPAAEARSAEPAKPAAEAAPAVVATQEPPKKQEPSAALASVPESGFFISSLGRAVAATDPSLRPARDADIVRWGSRLDETTYVQLEVQRQDYWKSIGATTRVAIMLAAAAPVYHFNTKFEIRMALRNLFVEERDLGLKGLSAWVGSRMYRGDNSEILDFWPLDWLNAMGGGARYELPSKRTFVAVHTGVNQPTTGFFQQTVDRPAALSLPSTTPVNILDRQKLISSLKVSHTIPTGVDSGVKGILYGELHQTGAGERETKTPGVLEHLPRDSGYVVGGQISVFTEKYKNHLHLFLRYAGGMAAYGETGTPFQLAADGTSAGAREMRVTWSGNIERGPVGVMFSGYVRSFRDASLDYDFDDLDEGIVMARPHFYFTDWGGLALEASYQAQLRGRAPPPAEPTAAPSAPAASSHRASLVRFALVPFLNAGGKGDYTRPQFRFIWLVTRRDEGAKALYPRDDLFSQHDWEHFIGLSAEWNFKPTTAFP